MVDAYFHTHREMIDDVWLIQADPSELGLLEAPWVGALANFLSDDGALLSKQSQRVTLITEWDSLDDKFNNRVESI